MAVFHYFPGGNTCRGFRGFFEELLTGADIHKTYVIKGGPGVGKSTLMRRVGAMWEQAGRDVAYYYCSGDPDSVDAVASGDVVLCDGTAPHIQDPPLPGAGGGVVNLGVCLNQAVMADARHDAQRLSLACARHYARAYRYLAGAHKAWEDSAAIYAAAVDHGALCNLRLSLMEQLRGGAGQSRRLYAQAVTHKGLVQHAQSVVRPRTICLDTPFGFDTDSILRPLAIACEARGVACLRFMDPVDATRTAHIATDAVAVASFVLPEGGRGDSVYNYTERGDAGRPSGGQEDTLHNYTGQGDASHPADGQYDPAHNYTERVNAGRPSGGQDDTVHNYTERITLPFDPGVLAAEQSALSFNRAAYRLLLGQAVESLREAKDKHDALERLYIDAMDYDRYEEIAGEVLLWAAQGLGDG